MKQRKKEGEKEEGEKRKKKKKRGENSVGWKFNQQLPPSIYLINYFLLFCSCASVMNALSGRPTCRSTPSSRIQMLRLRRNFCYSRHGPPLGQRRAEWPRTGPSRQKYQFVVWSTSWSASDASLSVWLDATRQGGARGRQATPVVPPLSESAPHREVRRLPKPSRRRLLSPLEILGMYRIELYFSGLSWIPTRKKKLDDEEWGVYPLVEQSPFMSDPSNKRRFFWEY